MGEGVEVQDSTQDDPHAGLKARTAATRFKPGQSGNPTGGSAKLRLRAAFERVFDEPTAGSVAKAVAGVAADPSHPHWSQAVAHTSRILGLVESEKPQEIVVTTEIELSDRSDGTRPKIEVRNVTTANGGSSTVRADGDDSVEVEV